MYLTQGRVHTVYGARDRVASTIGRLWPRGFVVTEVRCLRLYREWCKENPGRAFEWGTLAEVFLTHEGHNEYYTRHRQWQRDHGVERTAASEEADGRRLLAIARWRRQYGVTTGIGSSEARAAYQEITDRYQAASFRLKNELGRFETRLFAELAAQYTKSQFVDAPKVVRVKDGEVLVTSQTLRALGSCGEYVNKFQRLFPDGTVITTELCVEHHDVFDWHWAASNLLDHRFETWDRESATASEALRRRRTELSVRLNDQVTRFEQNYRDGRLTARQYDDKRTLAYREHDRGIAEVDVELTKLRAQVFGDIYAKSPNPRLPELTY